jgi:hypothetical protein
VPTHEVNASALELRERSGLRRSEQPQSRVERPRLEAHFRRRQRALDTATGIHRKRDSALQECGGGGESATSLRTARGTLELVGDFLTGPRHRSGTVPRAAIRIRRGIRGFGEGGMHAVAVVRRSGVVGSGAGEWVRELDAPTYLEQPRVQRSVGGGHVESDAFDSTLKERRVAQRLCCGREDQQLRVR